MSNLIFPPRVTFREPVISDCLVCEVGGQVWFNDGTYLWKAGYPNPIEESLITVAALWPWQEPYSYLSWNRCAECNHMSWDDYLCKRCRRTSV